MRTIDELTSHLNDLPMFPLSQIVFFPHSTLPLHIFEPRYREMIRDARADDLPIVLGNILPDAPPDEFGRPRVAQTAGVGFMQRCEELPDGRFLVELHGLARVSIVKEHSPQKLYRRVQVEMIDSHSSDIRVEEERLETIQLVVASLRSVNVRVADFLAETIKKAAYPGAIADSLAAAIVADPLERQGLLEERDITRRVEAVLERLTELLAIASQPDGSDVN